MPLTGLKLYGSTVKGFSTNVGWGTERSSVKVTLVEDTFLGDYFLPPPIGALTYVTFHALNFWGILQRWSQGASADGLPTYEVTIEDPRAILEGTEVILGGYNATTFGVPNLLNAYGYLENLFGFGGSQLNDSGIPWNLLAPALQDLTSGASLWGQPLTYKGYAYLLDLTDMPAVPNYYRVGGSSNMNLMEIIQRVCADAGCDFFVELTPGTTIIKVRTVSRRLQPVTGYIQALVNEATTSGTCIRSQVGLEAVNNATSAFIVGGQVQTMYEAAPGAITPYFGKDVNGNPILSTGTNYDLVTNLNASEVFDLIGSYGYTCTALEMCCAMADINTWLTYMFIQRTAFAEAIGLVSPYAAPADNGTSNPVMPQDVLNLTPATVLVAAGANVEDVQTWITQRMYNFVQKNATEFLGKKYLVQIPFMFTATEPDSGRLITSYEVATSGYVESGAPPLALHPVYTNLVSDAQDLFLPYALFSNLTGTDLSRVSGSEFIVDIYTNNGIYVNVNVAPEIVFLDELTPCVVVTVNNPLYNVPLDATGAGIAEVAAIFQMTPEQAEDLFNKLSAGNAYGIVHTLPRQPDYCTIPLKSNILTYGPWYAVGAQGRVAFQQDTSLVPWNYGNSTVMNLAANAKVVDAITFQQAAESGTVELSGEPLFNIGDQLELAGEVLLGPTITGIDVSYSDGGVTSNYRLQTFTVKFGAFSKDNVERLRRISLKTQEVKRELRESFNRLVLPREVTNDLISILGAGSTNQWPKQFSRGSPHSVLTAIIDADGDDPTLSRVSVTTLGDREIAPAIPAHDTDLFDKSAMMSLTGVVRPINTDYNSAWLACYEEPNSNYPSNSTGTFLNPFKTGNDVELYTRGNTYTDAHAYLNGGSGTAVRGFALRGPLIISGWGWSTDDAFVPNADPTGLTGAELSGYLRKSWFWKTGPVDLLWDDERMVWTPHGMMIGTTVGTCSAGGSTTVKLHDDSGEVTGRKKDRTVWNFFSQDVPASRKIIAAWVPDAQRWYIIAADCV